MKASKVCLFATAFAAWLWQGAALAQTITVGGTGSAAPIIQKLAEAYRKNEPASAVTYVLPPLGSSGAVRALIAGRADPAVIGRPLSPDEQAKVGQVIELGRRRAIVVDDNATNRQILDHQLRKMGLAVETAADGQTALKLLAASAQPIDLAVLDMHMPAMDGLDLARRIRREAGEDDRISIVILSSVADTLSAEELKSAKVIRCLRKPVRQVELNRCVLEALGSVVPAEGEARRASPMSYCST